MSKIFYLHWNEVEAKARVAALKKAGYEVVSHWRTETRVQFGDTLPAAVVISLDRLPSHGRAVAEWFVEAKKRQHIPVIFAGGQPEKCRRPKRNSRARRFVQPRKCWTHSKSFWPTVLQSHETRQDFLLPRPPFFYFCQHRFEQCAFKAVLVKACFARHHSQSIFLYPITRRSKDVHEKNAAACGLDGRSVLTEFFYWPFTKPGADSG